MVSGAIFDGLFIVIFEASEKENCSLSRNKLVITVVTEDSCVRNGHMDTMVAIHMKERWVMVAAVVLPVGLPC